MEKTGDINEATPREEPPKCAGRCGCGKAKSASADDGRDDDVVKRAALRAAAKDVAGRSGRRGG